MHREMLEKGYGPCTALFRPYSRFRCDMGRALRRPGERMDIIYVRKLDDFIGPGSTVRREDLVLLWSETDRDFRAKVADIRPNPAAGSAPRNHLVSLRRLSGSLTDMTETMKLIEEEILSFTRVPLNEIDAPLNAYHAQQLERWREIGFIGKKSLEILPFAVLRWLQQHRQFAGVPHQLELYSESRTHRVHLGQPSLTWMIGVFQARPKVRRQCLLPHLSKDEPNDLLIFERGPKWRTVSGSDSRGDTFPECSRRNALDSDTDERTDKATDGGQCDNLP